MHMKYIVNITYIFLMAAIFLFSTSHVYVVGHRAFIFYVDVHLYWA